MRRGWRGGDGDEEIPGQAECGGAAGIEDIGVPWPGGGLQVDPRARPPFSRGQALLLSDEAHADGAMKDEDIARVLQIGRATVERVRRRCVEEGIEAALGRKEQQRRRPKKLDGAAEARLIALACGEPPEGRARWTLRLLSDRLVECEIVESIHPETVRKTLKKRTQALAERVLVHPAGRQFGLCVCHGRRAGDLSPSL